MDNTTPQAAASAGQASSDITSSTSGEAPTGPAAAAGSSRPAASGTAGQRRPGARRQSALPSQPRVRLSSPAGVLAAVPHLLGFHPARSLVVIGADGPRGRVRFGCRYDLPDPPDPATAIAIAEHAAGVLTREQLTTVIAAGYGPGRLVTPLADVLVPVLRERGLTLRELLRAEDGRYWSYLCSEPGCCPPEGVPFDPGSHPVAAAMTVAGLPAYPDREALGRLLDPVTGKAAARMRAATDRAYDRAGALVAQATRTGPDEPQQTVPQGDAGQRDREDEDAPGGSALRLVLAEGKRAVRDAIAAYRDGSALSDDQFGWLSLALTDLRVRDDAWSRMEPEHASAHLRLWTELVRRADPALVPAPAALLGFVAWQSGNGALAGLAIERALAADPDYSLALLLRDIVAAGVPPSAARLPMTPEEVEESYARAARTPQPDRRRTRPGRS